MTIFDLVELGPAVLGRRARQSLAILFVVVAVASPSTRNRLVAWWVDNKSAQIVHQLAPLLAPPARGSTSAPG